MMANEEQLAILEQGVDTWNEWRKENQKVEIDLREADLSRAALMKVNLREVDLSEADLSEADLKRANLRRAELSEVNLTEADLKKANVMWARLMGANLSFADLKKANLKKAFLAEANLTGADLDEANLVGANLISADLSYSHLMGVDLSWAAIGFTMLVGVDLSHVKGLDTLWHDGPSTIDIVTIYDSKGNIPEGFLRECGVPKDMIALIHSIKDIPFKFSSCFISYSSKDTDFAERLHADLQSKGVRVWFAPEDLKIGDKFRTRIDEAIKMYDKSLIVLSENSINSSWVEKEVETAFEKENREKRTVLFPIRLDDSVMETNQAWAADLRRMRNIGDFTGWKNRAKYQKAFERLMRDLKASEEKK